MSYLITKEAIEGLASLDIPEVKKFLLHTHKATEGDPDWCSICGHNFRDIEIHSLVEDARPQHIKEAQ